MTNVNQSLGKKVWAFAAGHIPFYSTGTEPAFTSHDKIAILNTGDVTAEIVIKIFYDDSDEVEMSPIFVGSRRLRKIRFNDLVNPLPVPLDKPYGFILTSSENVVVQFSRMNTGAPACAMICTNAYPS